MSDELDVQQAIGPLWRTIYKLCREANREELLFFLTPYSKYFTGYILYKNERPIGYIVWNHFFNDESKPVMRQIYILPEERRKGYGSYLFETSRAMFTQSQNLVIESPNSASAGMLIKLGVLMVDEDKVRGTTSNVTFVHGG